MKKIYSLTIAAVFLLSSCKPATTIQEPTIESTNIVVSLPNQTEIPSPTSTPKLIPTQTLSPDPNIYECAENVSKEDCDFVKAQVGSTRHYLINNLGGDISAGVKIIVDNIPSEQQKFFFRSKKGEEPYIYINTGELIWIQAKGSEFEWRNKSIVGHEFTHFWQYDHGCIIDYMNNPHQDLILEGMATWVGLHVAGITPDNSRFGDGYSDERALSWWQSAKYDWRAWFESDQVPTAAVKHLVDDNDVMALRTFCDVARESKDYFKAFQSAFGLPFEDFRVQFMDEVLGSLKDCTVATCGDLVDNFIDKYKLGHLLDQNRSTPNLIVKFVDQNNELVILSHVSMLKQNIGTTGEYVQPFIVPGIFSKAMLPGRYSFFFCEPGFPATENDKNCQYHETDWFDVSSDKVTELTFQIPLPIEDPSLSEPNLSVEFFDKDGNPVPNLGLQICSYENPVRVCSNQFAPDRKTDSAGVYHDSLRSGKYLIRIPASSDFEVPFIYQVLNIDIDGNNLTSTEYHFPTPNLVIKLTDAVGSPIPEHDFVLCKVSNGTGDCNSSIYNQGRWGITNKAGAFEALVEPGEYYILTCKIGCSGYPFDYTITDIKVTSETEVTTIEFQLYK